MQKSQISALTTVETAKKLGLLPEGTSDKAALLEAVQRFLSCAPAVAAIPERLYPR